MASSEAVIRPYTPQDAAGIAELYNRHHDVPAWVDRELTPEMVLAEFAERGTVLFLVVEEAGEVLGTLGMFRACGMRVVPENEVIGSMFYLAPRIRGGMLAGKLFSLAFRTVRDQGVEAIRLTVNPSNQLALPLYRQLGCVVVGPAEADEDGDIEMVSWMPKIVTRLREEHGHLIPADLSMTAAWRYQADGIAGQELGKESELLQGRTVLRTALSLGELTFRAILDPDTGEILHTEVGAEPGPDPVLPPRPAGPAEPVFSHRSGRLNLTVRHSDGAVRVFHDDWVGPVLQETWPVFGPAYLTGWRQALRHRITVQPLPDGWLASERQPDGTLHRESRLVDGALYQRVWWTGGPAPYERLRTLVVNGLRSALLLDDRGYRPAGRGLYPANTADYQGARTRLRPGGAVAWWEPRTGLSARVHWSEPAEAGLVTDSLLALDHPSDYAYHVELHDADRPQQVLPLTGPAPDRGLALRPSGPLHEAEEDLTVEQAAWDDREVARRPVHRMVSGDHTVLLDAAAGGIASWQSAGKPVLGTPFPRARAFARNPRWRSGLWVTRQGTREDENHGLGWGSEADPVHWDFDPAAGGLGSPELSWSLAGHPTGITVTVRAQAAAQDGELVVWLTPTSPKAPELLVPGGPGEVWSLDKPGAWQRWTDRVAVRLPDGRWLATATQDPGSAQILVRSTPSGPLLALVARHPHGRAGSAHWPVSVLADADAAERYLTRQPHSRALSTEH